MNVVTWMLPMNNICYHTILNSLHPPHNCRLLPSAVSFPSIRESLYALAAWKDCTWKHILPETVPFIVLIVSVLMFHIQHVELLGLTGSSRSLQVLVSVLQRRNFIQNGVSATNCSGVNFKGLSVFDRKWPMFHLTSLCFYAGVRA